MATGGTAAFTPTDHSTAYPGGGASKKSWRSHAQFCHQLDRPSATTTKRRRPKPQRIAKDFDDSFIAVVAPRVAFLGFLGLP